MQLNITGKAGKVTKQQIADAVYFYAEYLMSDRLLQNIEIEVVLEKDLIRNEGDQAYCVNMSDSGAAREFEISIDSGMGKRALLLALAHEMVHVKQYAKGELKYLSSKKLQRFQGKDYHPDYLYWEKPWEIEAFGRELGLYSMFKHSQKKAK
jgi:hypothetical protein